MNKYYAEYWLNNRMFKDIIMAETIQQAKDIANAKYPDAKMMSVYAAVHSDWDK